MADLIHTIVEIEDIFREVVLTIFGLDINENHDRVRFPWGSNLAQGAGSAPGCERDEDVCFIYALPQDDAYNKQRNRRTEYRGGTDLVGIDEHTDLHSFIFVNYGRGAYENARDIRDGLFREDIRRLLKKHRFTLVTDVPSPKRAPELVNGEWWNRADVTATFNEFVRRESPVRTIRRVQVKSTFLTRAGDVNAGVNIRRPSCKEKKKRRKGNGSATS